jgi:regulator of sirC expression with transglutaminase-like and TPR domain
LPVTDFVSQLLLRVHADDELAVVDAGGRFVVQVV